MFTPKSNRLKSVLLFVFSLSLASIANVAAENLSNQTNADLPYVVLKDGSDLARDGKDASKKQIPILMMFSMKHCPYCIEVEEDYLKPMLRNAEYDGKVIIRKIRLDGTDTMRYFSGKEREPGEFSADYHVSMVPTLVLVNAKGKRLAPSIIGIANSHYYSSELDIAIDASTQIIRAIAQR